jgi:hypothetical protein
MNADRDKAVVQEFDDLGTDNVCSRAGRATRPLAQIEALVFTFG